QLGEAFVALVAECVRPLRPLLVVDREVECHVRAVRPGDAGWSPPVADEVALRRHGEAGARGAREESGGTRRCQSDSRWNAVATASGSSSQSGRATSSRPTGRPSASKPHGTETAAEPTTLHG